MATSIKNSAEGSWRHGCLGSQSIWVPLCPLPLCGRNGESPRRAARARAPPFLVQSPFVPGEPLALLVRGCLEKPPAWQEPRKPEKGWSILLWACCTSLAWLTWWRGEHISLSFLNACWACISICVVLLICGANDIVVLACHQRVERLFPTCSAK